MGVAIGLTRLGCSAAWVSRVSADEIGDHAVVTALARHLVAAVEEARV